MCKEVTVWQASLGSTGTDPAQIQNGSTIAGVINLLRYYLFNNRECSFVSEMYRCKWYRTFSYTVILIDDQGKLLDSFVMSGANVTSGQVNLSATSWNPQPGMRSLIIRLLDEGELSLLLT